MHGSTAAKSGGTAVQVRSGACVRVAATARAAGPVRRACARLRASRRAPYAQIEKHARVEEALELVARRGADRLDHRAALPDDDRLLRFALDEDGAVQAQQALLVGLLEAVDDDRRRKRQLRVRVLQHLLAHELGDEEPLRLVGQVIVRVESGSPSGRCDRSTCFEPIDVVARQRRNGHDVGEARRPGRSAR